MNASTQLNRVDGGPEAGDTRANRRRITSARAPARRGRKEPTSLKARINSLNILAQTLLREVGALEEQNANGAPGTLDLQTEVRRFEAELIRSALIRTGGRQRPAARLLGMKATTLNSKIKRYKIDRRKGGDAMKVKTKVRAGEGNGLDPHGNPKP